MAMAMAMAMAPSSMPLSSARVIRDVLKFASWCLGIWGVDDCASRLGFHDVYASVLSLYQATTITVDVSWSRMYENDQRGICNKVEVLPMN